MKRADLVAAVFIMAFVTAISYQPLSILLYKIKEPHFKCPIRIDAKNIPIRNDARGEGEFGAKRRNGRSHAGIDMLAPIGTPVYASKSGVAFLGDVPTGYGKYIMIYHPDSSQTIYGHLSSWCVFSTKRVRQGELIGFVGKTGNARHKSIEAHLHFEILKEGIRQNPRELIR